MNKDRIGSSLIVTTLIVIATITTLLVIKQRQEKVEQIRVQGVSLTRALPLLSLDVLAPNNPANSVLRSFLIFVRPPAFAYVSVVSSEGETLAEETSQGINPSREPLPSDSRSSFGERRLELQPSGKAVQEFYGPVIQEGQTSAYIRVGYFEPSYSIAGQDLSFLAILALLTFFLVPTIYFILRRELLPLVNILHSLHSVSQTQMVQRRAITNMDIASFVRELACGIDAAHQRIATLEKERFTAVTANRLLEYSSNKMNFVLNSMPDGLLMLDLAGHVTFASEKVKPLLGVDNAAVLTQPIESWCADEDLKQFLFRNRGSAAGLSETISISPKTSPDKHVRVTALQLVAPDEAIMFGTLVVIHDATQEHIGQEASHEFVAHVSHELKSPLNIMAMYAEILQDDDQHDERTLVEARNVIHGEVERMAALVNNLLNISKLETGGLKPNCARVRTEEMLKEIFDTESHRADAAGIRMTLDVAHDISQLSADKDLLRIAITNLVTNALKYSDADGKVSIHARETDAEIIVTVRDNGVGISPVDQARIFEKFYRAPNESTKRSGHGLGLYLANQIVQLHHGQIRLESELGKGSAFSIHLAKTSMVTTDMAFI